LAGYENWLAPLAEILVSRWQKTGVVPTAVQRRLIEIAWERGIDITAHDMIFGREIND